MLPNTNTVVTSYSVEDINGLQTSYPLPSSLPDATHTVVGDVSTCSNVVKSLYFDPKKNTAEVVMYASKVFKTS